jgi:hypothetical protein
MTRSKTSKTLTQKATIILIPLPTCLGSPFTGMEWDYSHSTRKERNDRWGMPRKPMKTKIRTWHSHSPAFLRVLIRTTSRIQERYVANWKMIGLLGRCTLFCFKYQCVVISIQCGSKPYRIVFITARSLQQSRAVQSTHSKECHAGCHGSWTSLLGRFCGWLSRDVFEESKSGPLLPPLLIFSGTCSMFLLVLFWEDMNVPPRCISAWPAGKRLICERWDSPLWNTSRRRSIAAEWSSVGGRKWSGVGLDTIILSKNGVWSCTFSPCNRWYSSHCT